MAPRVRIGTSGWNYPHWQKVFFPADLARTKWLDYLGKVFDTVEVNATFYRSMRPSTFAKWYRETPQGFVWAVKANRFITHIRRLEEVSEPLQNFLASLAPLKEKLGPVLFQLPPSLSFSPKVPSGRFALEARNESWLSEEALCLLKEYQIAWCISDTAGRFPYREAVTTDFIYIRLHGSQRLYTSSYTDEELSAWARKILAWNLDTYVYFDNDFAGYAPINALRLKELLKLTNEAKDGSK